MKKYILALDDNNRNSVRSLYLNSTNEVCNECSHYQRSSPVFLINNVPIETKLFCTGKILLIYTLDTFYKIGRINLFYKGKNSIYIFQTLGLASILIYSQNIDENFQKLIEKLGDNIIGYEIFNLNNNILNNLEKHLDSFNGLENLNIDFENLENEERVIFNEIIPSFNFFQSFINSHIHSYKKYAIEIRKTILDLYYRLIYLDNKISETTFRSFLDEIFIDKEIIVRVVETYNSLKQPRLKIIHHFQLIDELLQIAAILRTINYQAFYGLNCFELGYARTGYNALFGTGLAYGAIYSIYTHMHELFSQKIDLVSIKKTYLNLKSPELQKNPAQYEIWRRDLQRNKGIDNINLSDHRSDLFYHLIYISNRLGFRETKRSISIAQQTISLGYTPQWSFNTFTHEFMHAHVRGLLSMIYPIDENGEFNIPSKLLELFAERDINTDNCENLIDFLKVNILIISHNLYIQDRQRFNQTTNNYKDVNEDELLDALKRFHHEIDEIMVHILDFHYFYRAIPEVYIKSIWSSWLTLPVTVSRIPEYLIRTITAISTCQERSRKEQFNWAIKKTEEGINALKDSPFIDPNQIDTITKTLSDTKFQATLQKQFYESWCPLADLTLKFLYSTELKDFLNIDFENELKTNGNYEYKINEGDYAEIRIDSPINFLNYLLNKTLTNNNSKSYLDFEEIECNTAWMISILNSKNNIKP